MKEKKKQYGMPVRIKSKTIDLIDRMNPKDIPFNTKLYDMIKELAVIKGVIAEK